MLDLGDGRRGRVQGRVAQPPVRGRAVPGRGDRHRRDPARHHRDGRAADRAPRRALVRRARPPLRARGRRHRRLRQLRRRRRTSAAQTVFDEAYAGNCLVNAMCVGILDPTRLQSAKAQRAGQPRRPLRRDDRPRRHRRRVGAREPGARRGRRRQAAVGAGRRSVHRQEADRGLASSSSSRASSSRCRTAAPPGSRRRSRRWRATAPASTSTSTACRCARRAWSRGRS